MDRRTETPAHVPFTLREVSRQSLEPIVATGGVVLWQLSHGEGEFRTEASGKLALKEGQTVVHSSRDTAHCKLATAECRALDLRLTPPFLDEVAQTELGLPRAPDLPRRAQCYDDATLSRLGRSLLHLSTTEAGDRVTRLAVARAIAARLLGHHIKSLSDSSRDGRIRRVIAYIEAHIDEPLALRDIADVAGYSVFHFSRVFREATGQTTKTFIRKRRVARARRLIETTNLPLAEIALSCGFAHQSHFTTVFTAETGVTPSRFRADSRAFPP